MKRTALFFLIIASIYVAPGFLPGRTFAPLDIPLDLGAWKSDAAQRVRPANSLLSDVVVQFIPWDAEIRRLIAQGEVPFVNRFAGDGAPLFANPQTAMFSPFTWPRLLFGLDGWAIMALLKLLAAALCAYWLARELDVPHAQAVVSALVYTTAAYTIVWLLYPITNVFALLPGLAAAAFRLMKEPRIRNALFVIVFAALCTAGGHPETLFIGVIGIWVFLAWEAEKRRELGITAIIPSTIGAFLGFLAMFVQLAPFFVHVRDSYAGAVRPLLPHPFRAWSIVSQILPGILGTPLRGELDLSAVAVAEDFNHRAGGYIGALVLLALLAAWRELTPTLRRGLIIGGVALAVSWCLPGVWPLLRNLPLFEVVALEYGVVPFVLFGSIAAGPAIAALASRRRRKIGAMLIIAGAIALLAGLLPALSFARPTLTRAARSGIETLRTRGHLLQAAEVYEQRLAYYLDAAATTTVRRVAVPAALWLLAGLALAAHFQRRALVVAAAAVGELVAFGAGFNPAVRMNAPPPEPAAIAQVKQLDPARRFLVASNFEVFPANLGTLYGVRDATSYDVLMSKARVEEWKAAGYNPLTHSFNPILSAEQKRAAAALGVRFLLTRDGVEQLPDAVPQPMPANAPPRRFLGGAITSLLALLGSALWLHLYRLPPPVMEGGHPVRPGADGTSALL
ncbi:MAG TPA: hypothetical protein VNA69_02360 [Thermoanaerobaculia bacterium]|nr:hypothetical protein [Thermoanaerobaculia bacterium]